MKQIEVQIMGQGYLLACPDNGEAALMEAVGRVDAAMCKIRDAGKVKARERIAVLAALNLAYEASPLATPDPEWTAPAGGEFAHGPSGAPAPEVDSTLAPEQLERLMERLDQALAQHPPVAAEPTAT